VDNSDTDPAAASAFDYIRIHAVREAVHHVGGDLIADVADEGGHCQPGYRLASGLA